MVMISAGKLFWLIAIVFLFSGRVYGHDIMAGFKGSQLCQVSENTKNYLDRGANFDPRGIHGGQLGEQKFSLERVKQTLDFICQTYREDVRAGRQSRLHDVEFMRQHFVWLPWQPDLKRAHQLADETDSLGRKKLLRRIPDDKILLTKYYAKLVTGSDVPTARFKQALYRVPYDETGLSEAQAAQKKGHLTRFKYTRQQIMQGVLEQQALAQPLIYLTTDALHDVLLQGTAVVKEADKLRYFNVDRNNGIDYDYRLEKDQQSRYWYFSEVSGILGYGKTVADKIQILPQVTVAGNVSELGLGKLIALSYQQDQQKINRLVVLADEGGAFKNNRFQLDLMVGYYQGWDDYYQANRHLPDFVTAHILLLKDKADEK